MIKIYTLGFTKKTAEQFFTSLRKEKIRKVFDTRLHNTSQLAGFAKRDDLAFLLKEVCNADYEHRLDLAPTKEILDRYQKQTHNWKTYEKNFLKLIQEREIEKHLKRSEMDHICLLCSEHLPHHCHRKIIAEYLQTKWKGVEIHHL